MSANYDKVTMKTIEKCTFINDKACKYYKLDGQVIYPFHSLTSLEQESRLIIELHDISVTDRFSIKIAEQTREAIVFPIIFNITYDPHQIIRDHLHIVNVRIVNIYDEILFVNMRRIAVRLLGKGRTTFIDIPVERVLYHDAGSYYRVREWPSLVGIKGEDAKKIIKKETGLKDVIIVTDRSKISKDIRYDRVCIYVDQNGTVADVPSTG
ncbi:hypothetical protein I4U23_012717 [Adineta vaga]|nr:hypothetical protein I4U23_012717 [Adineta vaga]